MPQATKAIKLLLEADEKTFRALDGQSKICNWLYNHCLETAIALRKEFIETKNSQAAKTVYSERGLRNLLPAFKEKYPFLKAVHSSPLKNTALRLSSSIQTHQKSKKGEKKKTGWPRFRSIKTSWFSLLYDEPNKGFKVSGNSLRLSLGLGEQSKRTTLTFTLKEAHRLSNHTIRNLRITKKAGVYYAVFTVEVPVPEKKPIQRIIALDPNHKNLASGIDLQGQAIEIEAPYWLKTFDRRIDELKGKRDRCLKKSKTLAVTDQQGNPTGKEYFLPSRRWQKFDQSLEKVYHQRQEQTKAYVYTIANSLCKDFDCIAVGNYTPQGGGITTAMRRSMNNRSLIGRFKESLHWVAIKSGKTYIEYDEKGTTRTCHCCSFVWPEGLCPSIRQWECPGCQAIHHRDENAAMNGLRKILRDLSPEEIETKVSIVPSSGLVSVKERWAWRVLPSGIQKIPRGQSSEKSQRQEMKLRA